MIRAMINVVQEKAQNGLSDYSGVGAFTSHATTVSLHSEIHYFLQFVTRNHVFLLQRAKHRSSGQSSNMLNFDYWAPKWILTWPIEPRHPERNGTQIGGKAYFFLYLVPSIYCRLGTESALPGHAIILRVVHLWSDCSRCMLKPGLSRVKLTNLICDGPITAAGPTYAALLWGKRWNRMRHS